MSTIPKYNSGALLDDTINLQNYQDSIVNNVETGPDEINKIAADYYKVLENYLTPSRENLELCQNISANPVSGGPSLPGAASTYTNSLGEGFVDNLGYLGKNSFPPVAYENERMNQLSNCAKDLPMFAASSLLPKPSTNADNIALSQDAARALAAFTSLSPTEQIGSITSNNTPYSRTSSLRYTPELPVKSMLSVAFQGSSAMFQSPFFGQTDDSGNLVPNGLK